MSQKTEHFIKNIKIKNFKCFKNFKAEGFDRVNLIGGKNNVGKTAFMEACYLFESTDTKALFAKLLEIKTHRNVINDLLLKTSREEDLQKLIKDNIGINIGRRIWHDETYDVEHQGTMHQQNYIWVDGNMKIVFDNNQQLNIYTKYTGIDADPMLTQAGDTIESSNCDTYSISDLINLLDFSFESTKYNFSLNFISPYSNSNEELENIIGQSKLDDKYDDLNKYLLDVFNVSSIDIIKNKPMLKVNNEYKELSYFGQGIKTFINITSSMLLLKDDIIFIDELENGIHYTNLDKLWEIILKISKAQNVQVFATTHSKECIESYARVAKNLKDEEITMTTMARNPKNELKALVWDRAQFFSEMEQNHEVRGW